MTNSSDYPTVTQAQFAWPERHPRAFGLAVIGVLVGIGAILAVLIKTEVTVPLLVPALGWGMAGWMALCGWLRRADLAQKRQRVAAKKTPPLSVPVALYGTPDERIGDEHRDGVLHALTAFFERGYLTLDEFGARQDEAVSAVVRGDLRSALRDLPL